MKFQHRFRARASLAAIAEFHNQTASLAVLSRAGMDVTVIEVHVYPGGCAGTFYHQGYRFDGGGLLSG